MKHLFAIAGRELGSYFVSPVAYAVLALFSLLAGFFFVMQVTTFDAAVAYYSQLQQAEALETINLNDFLLYGFYNVMWLVLLFMIPALTMGLFASEKQNGTDELLMTSPITIWELVLGKYLAAATMVTLLVAIMAALTGILFWFGDPEPRQTFAGLLGIWLVGLTYAAIGAFASSVTRSPLIAFLLSFALLLVLYMLGFVADVGMTSPTGASAEPLLDLLRWVSSEGHFDELTRGLIDTRALAYFAFMIGGFLMLAKTAVESVRWR